MVAGAKQSARVSTTRFRVVVTDQVFPSVEIEREQLGTIGAEVEVPGGGREAVLAAARDADALLNTYLPLDAGFLSQLTRCKIIARYGIGVDNVDLRAAQDRGIVVTNVPDYCVEEVAEHTLALLLCLLRRIPEGDAVVKAGRWGVDRLPVRRLSCLTVGLLGYGRIGRQLAQWLRAIGTQILIYDPYVAKADEGEVVDLDTLLSSSDVVSIHSPLTPKTKGLIGSEQLAHMRSSAILINTSRGGVVKLDDLLQALQEGRLGGAALDVFETEPPPFSRLAATPNLLTTPHVAFYSAEAVAESQRKAASQIVKVLSGFKPDYPVTERMD